MKRWTLREICTATGTSRRAVQGFEKAGMIAPCGKNERGYLLYDMQTLEQIRKIRFLQRLGFRVREIVAFRDADEAVFFEALKQRVSELKREQAEKAELIRQAETLITQWQSMS